MHFEYVDIHKRNTNSLYYFKKGSVEDLLRNLTADPFLSSPVSLIHAHLYGR